REGAELQGKPVVILWTRGRHTGSVRKTPLMRVRDGERYAVVASLGGAPKHPVWYLNLVADPRVSLQDRGELHDYLARVVTDQEKAVWRSNETAVWPDYDTYQASTARVMVEAHEGAVQEPHDVVERPGVHVEHWLRVEQRLVPASAAVEVAHRDSHMGEGGELGHYHLRGGRLGPTLHTGLQPRRVTF